VNAQIFLYDDSIVATVLLECFFRFDGLMCVEASGLDGDDGGESFANLTISLGLVSMSNREFVLGPIRILSRLFADQNLSCFHLGRDDWHRDGWSLRDSFEEIENI
jgi:hypothetical protein